MSRPGAPATRSTLAWLALLLAVPYATPRLARLRVLEPRTEPPAPAPASTAAPVPIGEVTLTSETTERPELAQPSVAELPIAAELLAVEAPPAAIEDPSGHALDAFFGALTQTAQKVPGAVTRVTWFGDSLLVSDWVTGTVRRRLQARFGDAGHGFLLLAAGWPGYFHNDVRHWASSGWSISRVVGPRAEDRRYGLGGVSFTAKQPGMTARFATAERGERGRSASTFTLSYWKEPGAGEVELRVDDGPPTVVSADAAAPGLAAHTLAFSDASHSVEVRVRRPPFRGFGGWLERTEPGIVVDAVGVLGARMRALAEQAEPHFTEVLAQRAPDLLVFEFGINEAEDGDAYPLSELEASSTALLQRARGALPGASCLVVGAMDRADLRDGAYVSRGFVPRLSAAQRRAAFAAGCAFWDAFRAMGGAGSMGRWVKVGLGGKDLAHPSSAGAELLGGWIDRALVQAFADHRAPSTTSDAAAPVPLK